MKHVLMGDRGGGKSVATSGALQLSGNYTKPHSWVLGWITLVADVEAQLPSLPGL